MSYTFIAIGCYVAMRSLQVLLERKAERKWARILVLVAAILTLVAGLASVQYLYTEFNILGVPEGSL